MSWYRWTEREKRVSKCFAGIISLLPASRAVAEVACSEYVCMNLALMVFLMCGHSKQCTWPWRH